MKTYTDITELAEGAISSGAKHGFKSGRTIGELLGIAFGGAAGAVVGGSIGVYDKIDAVFSANERKKVDKVAQWIAQQVAAGHDVTAMRGEYAEKFSGFPATTTNPVGKARYEAELRWFDRFIIKVAHKIDDMVSRREQGLPLTDKTPYDSHIRRQAIRGGSIGAKYGVAAVAPVAAAAGASVGIALGATWVFATAVCKLIFGASNKAVELNKIQFITRMLDANFTAHLSNPNSTQWPPDYNTMLKKYLNFVVTRKNHMLVSKHDAEMAKESQWFNDHYEAILQQYIRTQHAASVKDRAQRQKWTAPDPHFEDPEGSVPTTYRRLGEEHMKKFSDITEMVTDGGDPINSLFEQFMEKGVESALEELDTKVVNESKDDKVEPRTWIIHQVEKTERTHDDIKADFLKRFKNKDAKFFDAVIKEIMD